MLDSWGSILSLLSDLCSQTILITAVCFFHSTLCLYYFHPRRPYGLNPYDNNIPPAFGGGILIHAWNGTGQLDGVAETAFLTRLLPGTSWSDSPDQLGTGVVVRMLSESDTAQSESGWARTSWATLTVCHKQQVRPFHEIGDFTK